MHTLILIAHYAEINDRDIWPHLLFTCANPNIKGLTIIRHNKTVHSTIQTLIANIFTRFLKLVYTRTYKN